MTKGGEIEKLIYFVEFCHHQKGRDCCFALCYGFDDEKRYYF